MKFIAAVLFICCMGYISGCTTCSTKKISCAAFDEPAFLKWFPYNDSSRMVFKNTLTTDTFSYVVANANTSKAYEISRGGFENRNLPCGTSAYTTSANYNNSPYGTLGIEYNTVQEADNGPSTKNLTLHFNNADWYAGEITESSFANPIGTSELTKISSAENILFDNGITYQQVVILTNDTIANKVDRAYKIFIAKNIGIIGCEMFPSKQKWVLQ